MQIAALSIHSCPLGRLGSKDTGGMSVYVREVARELGKRGHQVDVFTRLHDPRDGQVVSLGKNARLIHLKVGEMCEIPKLDIYPYLTEFTAAVEDFRKNNNLHYELAHSHYWLSGWVGRQLQEWWKVPHVIMFHTLGAVKNAIGVGEDEPEIRIQTEEALVRDCQHIIVATNREKKELQHYYNADPQKIVVVPCGVNLQVFQPMDKSIARYKLGLDGSNLILFVGRIEPLKGIENLLSAMTYIKKEKNNTRLMVVGGDKRSQVELERLQMLCCEMQIQDLVDFVGAVNQDELPAYYSAADVCVVPSHHESFGLVALESLACGTPVIASRVGGIEDIVIHGKNGYIADNNSPSVLADRISMAFSRSIVFDSAEDIRASVSGFGWSMVTERIINVYRRMLDSAAN